VLKEWRVADRNIWIFLIAVIALPSLCISYGISQFFV
jgi:hypothetical protein